MLILGGDSGGSRGGYRPPKPASKPAAKPVALTRTQPPKGGKVSEDVWNILELVSQRINQPLQVQQGGYNPEGDPTSKGTHDKGGVVDLFVKGMSEQDQLNAVAELRSLGMAAWLRTPKYGWNDPNDEHIHAIFMNDPDLSAVARKQVEQYKKGQNGLANHAPDPFAGLKVSPAKPVVATAMPTPATSPMTTPTPTPTPYNPLSSSRPPTPATSPTATPTPTPTATPATTPPTPATSPTATPTPTPTATPATTPPTPATSPTAAPVKLPDWMTEGFAPAPAPAEPERYVAPAPVMNPSGYGSVPPPVPAKALPAPHPGATDFDRARAAGQTAPVIEPSQRTEYEVDFLTSLGWQVPKGSPLAAAPQTPAEMYAANSVRELARYSYQVDRAERDRITSKYRNVEGFIPPTDTQGMPDPDSVPFEAGVTTAELTWDAYDKLSNEARTAVDLNGLLVAARELDLSKQYKLEGDELNEYNRRTEAIFGKPDTSEKIAPNVVRLLTTVNWKAVGQDLDEYISLERGFTADELKDLDTTTTDFQSLMIQEGSVPTPGASGYNTSGTAAPVLNNYNQVRSAENMAAADAALAQAAGKRFDEVMANPTFNLWDLPSSMNLAMSGKTTRPGGGTAVPFGYGTDMGRKTEQDKAKEVFYQSAFNYLTDKSNKNLQPLWDEMTAAGFTPEDTKEFWRFVDDRTRKERRWGQVGSPYTETGRDFRNPDQIRKFVGLAG